ncbi:DUF6018 family natural product bioysynthesis protein [Terribacillus sp. DMT04]|uniref:DUF6018 family natural product bioysynthesis protein n=1 Tax=Terribacillus sp. DMT04 TaxID=2850441 RepID=UPI001C2C7F17|nr:DUF6018 family natural product bioysynthesis protein [Terribacillus sp. DMT04]QXE02892.1 hypothetical protein KS242_06885 [Terribacillus sp. DMT04]
MGSNTAKSSISARSNGLARIERFMKARAQIEYIYKGGQREFYRCKTRNKKEALQEVITTMIFYHFCQNIYHSVTTFVPVSANHFTTYHYKPYGA